MKMHTYTKNNQKELDDKSNSFSFQKNKNKLY